MEKAKTCLGGAFPTKSVNLLAASALPAEATDGRTGPRMPVRELKEHKLFSWFKEGRRAWGAPDGTIGTQYT